MMPWLTEEQIARIGLPGGTRIHVYPGDNATEEKLLAEVKRTHSALDRGDYELVDDPPKTGRQKRSFGNKAKPRAAITATRGI